MFVADIYARRMALRINSTPQDLFEEGVEFASGVDFTRSRTNSTVRFELSGS